MEDYNIDFVIPWVDGNDTVWLQEKERCWIADGRTPWTDGNKSARFRDWDNLHYWFRGIEKFTPWVNKIYFVTFGHVPEWLNTKNPKLKIINHKDYISDAYLPVFSANPIEINFHRIPGLAEHFVYFNDDMFVINTMKKEDFFVNGLPREMAAMYLLTNNGEEDTFKYMLFRMIGEVNKNFNLRESIRKNPLKWFNPRYKKHLLNNFLLYRFHKLSGLYTPHVPSSLRKSTMEQVWNTITEVMLETCTHKFRNPRDITQYIFRYWEIMKGDFEPTNIFDYSEEFFISDNNNDILLDTIKNQTKKLICVNDSIELSDFDSVKQDVISAFDSILPNKCSFEK